MKRASSLLHVFTTLFILFLCTVLFSGVPASAVDVDRDGKDDITVYRPSTGVWYILRSSDGYDRTSTRRTCGATRRQSRARRL